MSVHQVVSVVIVAVALATAVMGLAVLAGRVDGTKVQRTVRLETTDAQRRTALQVIRRGLAAPAEQVALVRQVARGQVSQAGFVLTFTGITLTCLSAALSTAPIWLWTAALVAAVANAVVAVAMIPRIWRARRFLATYPGVQRAASR